jgi:hypothetical protein
MYLHPVVIAIIKYSMSDQQAEQSLVFNQYLVQWMYKMRAHICPIANHRLFM